MAFPSGWGRKQKITIQSSQVIGTGSHSNVPVLITLDHLNSEIVDAGSNSALNGGGDIRLSSDAAGTTQLACEIVAFVTNASAGSRKCEVWVKVPSISTSVNTDIYIWYKKSGETQPAVTATYGRNAVWSAFLGVHHLGASGTDVTGNGNTLTFYNSPTTIDGLASDALEFNGSTQYAQSGTVYNSENAYTMGIYHQVFAPLSAIDNWGRLIEIGGYDTADGGVSIERDDGYSDWLYISYEASNTSVSDWDSFPAVDTWTSCHISTDSSNSETRCYENGVSVYSNSSHIRGTTATEMTIARATAAPSAFSAVRVDLVYVYGGILSSDWINTENNNLTAPASFATAGTPEAAEISLIITIGAHGHSVDNLPFTQNHNIVLADASQAHSADNLILDVSTLLEVSAALHGHLSGGLILTQVHALSVDAPAHGHTVENIDLELPLINLVIAQATQGHTVDELTLNQIHFLTMAGAGHSQQADNLELSEYIDLVVAGCDHAQTSDEIGIVPWLNGLSGNHLLSSDEQLLSQIHNLVTANATHGLGNDLMEIAFVAGIWRPQSESSDAWSEQSEASSSWSEQSENTNTWTEQEEATDDWSEQSENSSSWTEQ